MRVVDRLKPLDFLDIEDYDEFSTDYLIIGTGISGLSAAIEIAEKYSVTLITKSKIIETSTQYAQGGIAAVLSEEDNFENHINDTLYAGDGICDEQRVKILVEEGPERIHELLENNTNFDIWKDGILSLTKEAAHSKRRILHAGDTTGAEIERSLTERVKNIEKISIYEYQFLIEILDKNSALVFDKSQNKYCLYRFKGIILATGSMGQIYKNTSNPDVATGDGLALAYRSGAKLSDLEFVQFHPTTFYKKGVSNFLISEALRGEGGKLKNVNGEEFMANYHEKKELAPRDIVSRSIWYELTKTKSESVFLDMTMLQKEFLQQRFPNIYNFCGEYGIDISKDYIPVKPAAHYIMGGITVDENGKTDIKGIYAVGEAGHTGVHGANRLASNSLLEGLVFGKRVGKYIKDNSTKSDKIESKSIDRQIIEKECLKNIESRKTKLQEIMWENAGILRDATKLNEAKQFIIEQAKDILKYKIDFSDIEKGVEYINLLTISGLILDLALERKESRGSHFRTDYPEKDEKYMKHSCVKKGEKVGWNGLK